MSTSPIRLFGYIRDQPLTDYRFRFITEGARTILYSRGDSSDAPQPVLHGNRPRYPTACLETDAATAAIARGLVTVTVSTVACDGLIHPYYLKGRGCESGVFRAQMEFPAEQLGEGLMGIVVELRDVAIICVKRNREALREAIANRIRTNEIPFFHEFTQRADEVYLGQIALLDSVRLAFAFYHHTSGQVVRIVSDQIHKAARQSGRQVPRPLLLPTDLPMVAEQKAWLHIEGLASRTNANPFSMSLTCQAQARSLGQVLARVVRANLYELTLKLSLVDLNELGERVQCELRISDGVVDHAADVFFCRNACPQCQMIILEIREYNAGAGAGAGAAAAYGGAIAIDGLGENNLMMDDDMIDDFLLEISAIHPSQ